MGRPPRPIPDNGTVSPLAEFSDTQTENENESSELEDVFSRLLGTSQPDMTCWVYKYENMSGTKRNLQYQRENDIPALQDIYDMWGPGRYHVLVRDHKANRAQGRTEYIGPMFMGNPPKCEQKQTASGGGASGPFAAMGDMLDVFERFAGILNARKTESNSDSGLGMMKSVMELSQGIMTDAIKTNARLASDAQREIMAMRKNFGEQLAAVEQQYEETENTEEENMSNVEIENAVPVVEMQYQMSLAGEAIKVIEPLIEQYLPSLIGDDAISAAIMKAIKATELYKQLVGRPVAVQEVKNWITETHPAEASILIQKFNLQ